MNSNAQETDSMTQARVYNTHNTIRLQQQHRLSSCIYAVVFAFNIWIESDAAYLNETKARSTAAGYHFLSKNAPTTANIPINAPIHVHVQILREVCSSAAESELAATFHNAKDGTVYRRTLEELGHPQPATCIYTDNSTAAGIANDTVKQRRSKAMDMRYFWIKDRVRQGQFTVVWRPGSTNKDGER